MPVTRWLVLEPHDTVAVRDGRAFDAGTHSVARVVVPHPGTVAGAVGAAYQASPGAGTKPVERGHSVPAELLGPVVVQRKSGRWRPLFPAPRTLVTYGDARTRLHPPDPVRWIGVRHDLDGVSLLGDADGEPGGWISGSGLERMLHDPSAVVDEAGPPWTVERRVGLARDEDRTARDGMLYAAEHLRPVEAAGLEGLGFAVGCVSAPDRELLPTVYLGGEGRRARVHVWDQAGDDSPLPDRPGSFDDGRLALYLITPAVLSQGWRPAEVELRGGVLRAAAVGGPEAVAMGRPDRVSGGLTDRRLRWCVAAGSVYFLKFDNEDAAAAAAAQWHRRGFPQPNESLRTAGFGLALTGRW